VSENVSVLGCHGATQPLPSLETSTLSASKVIRQHRAPRYALVKKGLGEVFLWVPAY